MICRAFGRRWAESEDLRSLQEEMDRERRSAEPSGGDGLRAQALRGFAGEFDIQVHEPESPVNEITIILSIRHSKGFSQICSPCFSL